jgi:serine/threonine-protein kinase
MGAVYLAEHPGLGRRAAVKVLHPAVSSEAGVIQRFFNEARAANAVGHRGIVEAFDFGLLPSGAPYIVMELLEGESVAARIKRAGSLALADAIEITDQAAQTLGAAHEKGIVHRDVKPEHLFMARSAQWPDREIVKILDFGIAKLAQPPADTDQVRTRTGTVMGTPQYMSPEQCRDARDVDHRADIYSLGIVLHEMVAGVPPFASHSWGELVHMHIGVPPPALRSARPEAPDALEKVVLRALEKDPAARFQTMAELRGALERVPVTRTLLLEPPLVPARARVPEQRTSFAGATVRLEAPEPARPGPATLASAVGEVGRARTVRSRYPRWLARAAIGTTLAGAIAAGIAMSTRERPIERPSAVQPPVAPRPAVVAEPPAAPVAEPAGAITIEIGTEPPGTRVVRERDGATIGVTPLRLSWPQGSGEEALALERDGYRPERLVVPLDRGVTARLHLEPAAKRPARHARAKQRSGAAAARPPDLPATPAPSPRWEPPKI